MGGSFAQRKGDAPSAKCPVTRGEVDLDAYAQKDGAWCALQLAAPARRALVDANLFKLDELAGISIDELRGLHGIGPTAIVALQAAMKAAGISFRTR